MRRRRVAAVSYSAAELVFWSIALALVPVFLVACWILTTPTGPR